MTDLHERVARAVCKAMHWEWNENGHNDPARDAATAALKEAKNYLAENGWTSAIIEEASK